MSELSVENVTMRFGGVVAVNDITMRVEKGEIVALIGPNGAGKTTAFNVITGVYAPTGGKVTFRDSVLCSNHPNEKPVSRTPDKITALGIARTFQNIRLFKSLTALDNILAARHMHLKANVFSATLKFNAREERTMRDEAMALLEMMGMAQFAHSVSGSLPYGTQRHLEILRALSTRPKMLLLDEPAAGMNPRETDELGGLIRDIKAKFDLTVFMIEHHMNLVMDISDRIYVIDFGRLIAEGIPPAVQVSPAVIAAYLGVEE